VINVVESYKLIDLEIDGEEKRLKIDTKEVWNVFESEFEGNTVTVNEGDKISFVTENGEAKEGLVLKIKGKKEKTKIQFVPTSCEYEEIWSVMSIKEGTLKVLGDEIDETEDSE
jgi:hypothetical protein